MRIHLEQRPDLHAGFEHLSDAEKTNFHCAFARYNEQHGGDLRNPDHVLACRDYAWRALWDLAVAHQRPRIAALIARCVRGEAVAIPQDLDASGVGLDPVAEAGRIAAEVEQLRLQEREKAQVEYRQRVTDSVAEHYKARGGPVDRKLGFRSLFGGLAT